MLEISVDTSGTEADLRRLSRGIDSEMRKALKLAGRVVQAEAKKRSPKGPTKAQAKASGASYKQGGPGGLERSIIMRVGRGFVDVGVMAGEALKYAVAMHDGKYNLGPGSRAKGEGVGPKFLDRAYDENKGKVQGIFDSRANVAVARVA